MSGAGGLRRNSQCQCPFLEVLYAPSLSCSRVSFGSIYSNKFNKNFVNISLVLFLTARVKSMVSASILYQIVIDTRPQRSSGSPAHLVSTFITNKRNNPVAGLLQYRVTQCRITISTALLQDNKISV